MADKKKPAKPPIIVEGEEPKAEPKITSTGLEGLAGKTIDERMADLLRDHQKMGAR